MAGPAGFSDLINRKYDIQQDEASARAALSNAQAQSITAKTPFENALQAAQTGQTRAQTNTIQPLADASIASTLAGVGEAGARSKLYGAQAADISDTTNSLVDNVGLQALYRGHQAFSGGAQTAPAVNPLTPVTGSLGTPGAGTTSSVTDDPSVQAAQRKKNAQVQLFGGETQGLKKGTANVKGKGKMPAAAPQMTSAPAPAPGQTASVMPGSSPPQGAVGGLAAMLQAAMGATTVPGKTPATGNTDVVPAMLTPGEAVVNKQAVKHIPGGRPAIAAANAKGTAEQKKGPPSMPARGAPTKKMPIGGGAKGKPNGKNHVAVHIKMG